MENESFDLSGAVDMLKTMLEGEEGQQQLQNIMDMFRGDAPQQPGSGTGGIDPENLDMVLKLQQAMSMLNQQKSNDKTQLLLALRPFLKPSRQEKVDHAMKLMKLTGYSPSCGICRGIDNVSALYDKFQSTA